MTYISITSISKTARNHLLTIALATTALAFPLSGALAMDANTLPGGEKVIGGDASFDRSDKNVLNIKQGSDRLLIEWHKGFNIGAKATTNFHQPGKDSIVVNRVVGKNDDPTRILGNLNANGRVVILDRNGVIFGKGSRVDVGGLIASTGSISDKDFLKGAKSLTVENIADGKVTNAGQITIADAGLAAFVAPHVRNDGLIVARMGTVLMGDAKAVTFDLYGDGLMEVTADKNLKGTRIINKGKIDVDGGQVLLTAAMVDNVVHNLINVEKISKSHSFKVVNGKIVLSKEEAAKAKELHKAELAKLKEDRRKEREAKRAEKNKPKDKEDAVQPVPAEPEVAAPAIPEPEIVVAVPAEPAPAPAPVPSAPSPAVTPAPAAPVKVAALRVSRTINQDQIMVHTVAPAPEEVKDLALEIYGIRMPQTLGAKADTQSNMATHLNTLTPGAGSCDDDLTQPVSCLTVE